jgi:hypothetical protein
MPGDRARVSFDPTRKWRGPVAQQGRVTIEADLNEADTITAERDRLTTLDVVGPAGTPDVGYAVTATPAGAAAPAIPGDLQIGPGTLYLGGERLDLDEPVDYNDQPDWLDHSTDPLSLWTPPAVPSGTGASYELVYLLATEQEVSAVEDPALADVALGGPDTMGRTRIQQHFVRTPATSGECGSAWKEFVGSLGPQGLQFDSASMMLESTSALQVSFTTEVSTPGPCEPVATGGYLGAENQMIRVMVTEPINGVPSIVWGFDNASFLYRLSAATYDSSSNTTTVTLTSSPVDSYHYPALGQAVELLRDSVKLTDTDYIASPTGFVSTVTVPYDPTQRQLTFSGNPGNDYLSGATPQLYLRVWQEEVAAPPGEATALGDTGLAVTLSSSTSSPNIGDFWTFSLRPIGPSIVYPARYLEAAQPREGPRTWACPLAVLAWTDGSATAASCVPPFSSLVDLSGAGSCECTIEVGPDDLAGEGSFAALVAPYAGQRPITVCFEPGTYTLTEPIVLDPSLNRITLRACAPGVILQAPAGPGPAFTLGLIVVTGASFVTISGLTLVPPLAGFSPQPGAFRGLPGANEQLLQAYSKGLNVAMGISVVNAFGLLIEDCIVNFAEFGTANVFAAGVYAIGVIAELEITGCTFLMLNPPDQVPFYDLAAGNQAEPPYQVIFGYLQAPIAAAAFRAADAAGPAILYDAAIEQCMFQGLTVPMLAVTALGTLRIDQNTARDCYGGFWIVSVSGAVDLTWFDHFATGDPQLYPELAFGGFAALLDRIFALAMALARLLPTSPLADGSPAAANILAPGNAELARAREMITNLYSRSAASAGAAQPTASVGGTSTAKPPRPSGAGQAPTGAGANQVTEGSGILPPGITRILGPGGTVSEETIPTAETGTSVKLRLDFCDCQVDAMVANSYSAAGLLITDFAANGASVLVHGSRIRSRFPLGETVMAALLEELTVTGNIVANEVVPAPAGARVEPSSNSITAPASAFLTPYGVPAIAVTGNVFIDQTMLPPRPSALPPALTNWDVLNTVIPYVAPPTVTGISPTTGPRAGGTKVTIAGTGFTAATGVSFGSVSLGSTTWHVDSPIQVTATSPAGSGTVDVTVTNSAGTSATSSLDQFHYAFGHVVAAAADQPASATESAATGAPATGRSSSRQTRAKTPSAAAARRTQRRASPSSPKPSGGDIAAPTVTDISPTAGPAAGGTSVTITGTGFTTVTSVSFGSVVVPSAEWTVNSPTQITATSPAGSRPVDVTVTNTAGTSATSAADQFTYDAAGKATVAPADQAAPATEGPATSGPATRRRSSRPSQAKTPSAAATRRTQRRSSPRPPKPASGDEG